MLRLPQRLGTADQVRVADSPPIVVSEPAACQAPAGSASSARTPPTAGPGAIVTSMSTRSSST